MYYIKSEDRAQTTLFPESLVKYISSHNPVRIIDEYIRELYLEALRFVHSTPFYSGRNHPATMIKLYLCGYLIPIRSPRILEAETKRDVELMWLLKTLIPDFKTIADFRKDNRKTIVPVFFNLQSCVTPGSFTVKRLLPQMALNSVSPAVNAITIQPKNSPVIYAISMRRSSKSRTLIAGGFKRPLKEANFSLVLQQPSRPDFQ